MAKKISKFLYWAPRILSIIFILFLAWMSLDVLAENLSFGQAALALFMHNIPALVLLAVLLAAWRYEIVGGIAFILAGILYIAVILMNIMRGSFEWYMLSWVAQVSGIAFLIGIFFLIGWFKKKKRK